MKAVYCPYCGGRTKRNGRTSSGSQRWRCTACGASTTVRYDDTATRLDEFLGWFLSKDSQAAMPGGGRSFRRRTAEFWEVWPMPVPDGELHRVLHVDGIWVARDPDPVDVEHAVQLAVGDGHRPDLPELGRPAPEGPPAARHRRLGVLGEEPPEELVQPRRRVVVPHRRRRAAGRAPPPLGPR